MTEDHEPPTNDPIYAAEGFRQDRYARITRLRQILATPRFARFMEAQEKTGTMRGATREQCAQWLEWAGDHVRNQGRVVQEGVQEGLEYTLETADFFLGKVSSVIDEIDDRISDLQSDMYP